ncbi:MAG: T9SS type A sorting domain-containing protein [Flavobacteriaceae bacterium]
MTQKKSLLALLLLCCGAYSFAQTIVSTVAENKKVILEEFTGIHCVYCPEGHAIAQSIQNNNPGNVFLINIHVGSFAVPAAGEPDFRTSFGTAIANQSQLVGYPAGTVNRHYFAGMAQNGGTGTAMNRNNWSSASNQTLALASYLNMATEAQIDVQSREMTILVEAYYTDNSPVATNKLNVALLQNNTLGPQTGGGAGDEYIHQHRLIHLITGQWGEEITTTTSGSFVDRTYTYTIPLDHNGVPIELADLELVVFMTETNQEIISGNGGYPTFTNLEFQNDVSIREIKDIPEQCVNAVSPVVVIQNMGANTVTSLDIEYGVNGNSYTYTWNGNLTSLQVETVELPEIPFNFEGTNNVMASIPSDENTSNNEQTTSFQDAQEYQGDLTLTINTDNWGSEVRWNIKDYTGTVIDNGGPYGNNTTIVETIAMPSDNCYTFNLIDTYGDGGGPVTLTDANATVLYSTNGNYGSGESKNFGYKQILLGTVNNELASVVIFPNPAKHSVTIANAENATITIYDIVGKVIATQNNISISQEIGVSNLQTGTYFVKIEKDGQSTVERLIISK